MSGISFTLTGESLVLEGLSKLSANVQAQVKQELRYAAEDCLFAAQMACPVDTGALEESLIVDEVDLDKDMIVYVGVDEEAPAKESGHAPPGEYAACVEFGTVHMDAQPFLFPAFEVESNKLLARLGLIKLITI